MSLNLSRFAEGRPMAFHVTSASNVEAIRSWRRLRSTRDLLQGTGYDHRLDEPRRESRSVLVDAKRVVIRDQIPLRPGQMRLEGGWTLKDLLTDLNDRVFFWPGKRTGPCEYGKHHFRHYAEQEPVTVLRCPILSLSSANRGRPMFVCRYNSGAPRCNPAMGRSPRGPRTFLTLSDADFTASRVMEISFRACADLPSDTEIASDLAGQAHRGRSSSKASRVLGGSR